MGGAKRAEDEADERGWDCSDGYVCSRCVNDSDLSAVLREQEEPGQTCGFCGATPAAPLDRLVEAFVAGLRVEYANVDEEALPYDGSEGGYQLSCGRGTADLMRDLGDEFPNVKPFEAVQDALRDRQWVTKDLMWPRRDEALGGAWDAFCGTVKHKSRYVMWLEPRDEDVRMTGEVPPAAILEEIGSLVRRLPERMLRPSASS